MSPTELVRLMVGREIADIYARGVAGRGSKTLGAPLLAVEHLGAGPRVKDISFSVAAGEIVGLAGLVGAGRSECVEALFGLRRVDQGVIRLDGKDFRPRVPIDAVRAGIGFIPEDRRRQGLIQDFTVRENLLLAHLGRRRGIGLGYDEHRAATQYLLNELGLSPHILDDEILTLSGGMQQKVVLGTLDPDGAEAPDPGRADTRRRYRHAQHDLHDGPSLGATGNGGAARLFRFRGSHRHLRPHRRDQRRDGRDEHPEQSGRCREARHVRRAAQLGGGDALRARRAGRALRRNRLLDLPRRRASLLLRRRRRAGRAANRVFARQLPGDRPIVNSARPRRTGRTLHHRTGGRQHTGAATWTSRARSRLRRADARAGSRHAQIPSWCGASCAPDPPFHPRRNRPSECDGDDRADQDSAEAAT